MLCHVTHHTAQWNSVLVYIHVHVYIAALHSDGFDWLFINHLGSSRGTSHTHSLSLSLPLTPSHSLSLPSYLFPSLTPSYSPSVPHSLSPSSSVSPPLPSSLSLSNEVFVSVCIMHTYIITTMRAYPRDSEGRSWNLGVAGTAYDSPCHCMYIQGTCGTYLL